MFMKVPQDHKMHQYREQLITVSIFDAIMAQIRIWIQCLLSKRRLWGMNFSIPSHINIGKIYLILWSKMFWSLQFLMKIFENVNGTLNVIEDDLCECSAPIPPVQGEDFHKYHRHWTFNHLL